MQNFQIPLLRKTIVSKIYLKQDPLSMDPEYRANPSTIPMSWIQRSQRFVDPSHGHHSMARWSPPPTGFQGHLLNPYMGHRMEIVHQKGISMGRASLFRHVLCGNASHTFTIEKYTLHLHHNNVLGIIYLQTQMSSGISNVGCKSVYLIETH